MFILTCKATFKLGLACSAIMLLMKSGRLPAATPQVLSRVAFNVTIPCTLLIKSAETLASSQGDPRYLMVSATAIMQVIIGYTLGHFASAWAVRPDPAPPSAAQAAIADCVATSVGAPGIAAALHTPPTVAPPGMRALVQTACAFGNSLTLPLLFLVSLIPVAQGGLATGAMALYLLGWSPMFWTLGLRRLSAAADDMLRGRTEAGGPGGAGDGNKRNLAPQPPASDGVAARAQTAPDASLNGVRLRPANGATRTTPGKPAQPATLAPIAPSALPADMVHLPSVSELRRLESAGTAVPRTIAATAPAADGSDAGVGVGGRDTHGNSPASADRPEVLQGPTGVIPANGGVPGNGAVGGTADGNGAGSAAWPKIQMTPIADPREVPAVKLPLLGRGAKRRGAPQLPPATPPEPRWLQSFNRIMNPPLAATSCGLVLGLSPLGPLLLTPSHPAVIDFAARLPWELAAAVAALRCAAETMMLVGSATLVIQLIVLGSSLLPPRSAAAEAAAAAASDDAAGDGGWAALGRVVVPADRWEARLLAATAAVRLVALPAAAFAVVHGLTTVGALPPCRVCVGALLLQSCMPSAQNLVLMVNLREETKSLAPVMARLLFRQYLLAVVPMTMWISIFATYLGLHVT